MHFLPRPLLLALVVISALPALAQDPPAAAADVVADAGADVAVDAGVVVAEAPPPRPAFDEAVINDAGAPLVTTTDVIITFLKAMAALCVVLALAWLTLGKGIPKLVEKAQAGKRVKVVERIALDARRSLFLVDIDGRLVVLGGGDIVKLADLSDARPGRFAEVLSSTPPATPPSEKT